MMMNCFCGMVDQWKASSLISSQDHYQRSSPLRIADMSPSGFEPAQNLRAPQNFGLFTKIEMGCVTGFWCTFSAQFFHDIIPWQFQCHTFFPYQDIKQNVVLSSYSDNWWGDNCKIYPKSSSKTMADRGEKRARWKNKNLNISRMEKLSLVRHLVCFHSWYVIFFLFFWFCAW